MRHRFIAAVLALALPSAAPAVTVQGIWSLSGAALGSSGLEIRTSRQAGEFVLDLSDGEQQKLRLFRIWTDEAHVGSDDRLASGLAAGFDLPGASGSIEGSVRGHGTLEQWGSLDWKAPLEVAIQGGTLKILLTDQTFGRGVLGLSRGRQSGADVFARVRYVAGVTPSPVPLPAGLPLALAGLGLLALVRRAGTRRRIARAAL